YFTFGKVDLVPTVEEYTTLLRCPKVQVDKAYFRAADVPTFLKRLMNITGMSEQWVMAQIKEKGDSKCIPWKSLGDLILVHPDTRKKVDVFAFSIYGLVIFPKALGHIDDIVLDLFEQLDIRNPWLSQDKATFLKKSGLRFSREEYVEWRAPWMIRDEILYQCGDFDWVPLLGIWGAVGYAPILVLRQYRSRQFIPATDRKARLRKEEFGAGEKDRKVGRGKDSARIRHARVREEALKRDLLESQDEKVGLRAWVAKLKRSLHQHRSCNFAIELIASLTKIKELKRKIEELEATLQNCELRVELLETKNEHSKELLQRSQI
ncbi:hypothetical protein Golax_001040, partial [Gossypium laxum]|nr:hypothetical protein [Gossypium laxum]